MPRCPSPDRYTPCTSRSMEQHRYRSRANDNCPTSQSDILHQLSNSISLQENRVADLIRGFDIDLQTNERRRDIQFNEPSSSPGTPRPSRRSSLTYLHLHSMTRPRAQSPQFLRPGRLSPTTIERILSPNNSSFSEISSGVDTSYDSGLYQWLGIENPVPGSALFPNFPILSEPPSNLNTNPDASILSSRSANGQPSPLPSPSHRIFLPLSPPATVRPPFADSLYNKPEVVSQSPYNCNVASAPDLPSAKDASGEGDPFHLSDLPVPLLSKNISLQHYMPSATVLRHFQRVVDELRGLYVPNDEGNNVPKWVPSSRRQTVMSIRSLPGSLHSSTSPFSPPNNSFQVAETTSPHPEDSIMSGRASRATRELYTEMAVMLFGQVAEEEAQVRDMRRLADRYENLAKKKRGVALIIGMRGRE